MLTSSDSQWPDGQNDLRISLAFNIFTRLVITFKKTPEQNNGKEQCLYHNLFINHMVHEHDNCSSTNYSIFSLNLFLLKVI